MPLGTSTSLASSGPGFAGEFHLPDGTIHLRARAYSPVQDRFFQRDSFAGFADRPASFNRYAYAEGNPVTYTDPSGHAIGNPLAASWNAIKYGGPAGVVAGGACLVNPVCWMSAAYIDNLPALACETEDQRQARAMSTLLTYARYAGSAGFASNAMGSGSNVWQKVGNVQIVPSNVVLGRMRSVTPSPHALPPSTSRTAAGINDGGGMLYRGDGRNLSQLVPHGFQPRNPTANGGLKDFVFNNTGQFVSTSRSPGVAGDFANWDALQGRPSYIYTIDPRVAARGVDVNASLGWDVGQAEIAVPGGIGMHEIVGVRSYLGNGQVGPFTPNPYYRWAGLPQP